MSWKLQSNSGQKLMEFSGGMDTETREFLGDILLSSMNHDDQIIWTQTLNLVQFDKDDIFSLKNGFSEWRDQGKNFEFETNSYYYHKIVFKLETAENKNKALFSFIWSSWGITSCQFEMVVDQSCVLELLSHLESMLRAFKLST